MPFREQHRRFFAKRSPNLRIEPRDETSGESTVYIYDEIGFWGTTAQDFVQKINALDVARINLRINSPGGSVFDGMAIANALRNHSAHVTTFVDGVAASIASVIALAGDEVRMAENAFFMIHDPWAAVMGDAAEMRSTADMLDKIAGSIVGEYTRKTGHAAADVAAWMADETWFSAQEAVDNGFADSIDEPAKVTNRFDFSVFQHAPAALVHASTPVRSAREKRDLEEVLRDAGYSHRDAKAIAAEAPRVLERRDVEPNFSGVDSALDRMIAAMRS